MNKNYIHIDNPLSPREVLKSLKLKNTNKIIIGHLNINSIRNKFESRKYIINNNVDMLLISETKLNDTYPGSQFFIDGFHPPYRKDRNDIGGVLLFILFIKDFIPSRILNIQFNPIIECMVIEINLNTILKNLLLVII